MRLHPFHAQKTLITHLNSGHVSLNADEATILGAGLYGAGLSLQLKTKDIRLTDIAPYDIKVSYIAEFQDFWR